MDLVKQSPLHLTSHTPQTGPAQSQSCPKKTLIPETEATQESPSWKVPSFEVPVAPQGKQARWASWPWLN